MKWVLRTINGIFVVVLVVLFILLSSQRQPADRPRLVDRCVRQHADYMPIFTWICDEWRKVPD